MNENNTATYKPKVMCRHCQQVTWHTILSDSGGTSYDDDNDFWYREKFFTLKCLGCDTVCLLVESAFSEDYDPETGEVSVQRVIHPSPFKDTREPIELLYYVPTSISNLYQESIRALNYKLFILAAMGVRSLIEAIAIDQGISSRGLSSKIQGMLNDKIITPKEKIHLDVVKDMGNLAVHEIKKHHVLDISLGLDILETLLQILYIYPKRVEDTQDIISGRKKRN